MKKIGLALAAVASLAMAVPAEAQRGPRHYPDRYHTPHRQYEPRRNRNDVVLPVIGALVVGAVVGAAVADRNDRDDRRRSRYHDRYERDGYYYQNGYYYGPRGYYHNDRWYNDDGRGYRSYWERR